MKASLYQQSFILCRILFDRKKSKKSSKKDPTIKAMSEANSKLWEARLDVAEKSRNEYR